MCDDVHLPERVRSRGGCLVAEDFPMLNTFDAKSVTWDEDPHRRDMALAIVTAITQRIPLTKGQRLLDVGCGTGLVGLPLATMTHSLLGVDISTGMVERFRAKIPLSGQAGIQAEVRDLATAPLPAESVDVAVSAMAFHHIVDITAMLHALAGSLAQGGWLAIADLESEDGSFHDEPVPHRGFDPGAFLAVMQQVGLTAVSHERVHVLRKPGKDQGYPIFLAVARKL